MAPQRRNFRVGADAPVNRNLGPQFTSAGRIEVRNGVATVTPSSTPEELAASARRDRQRQADTKASKDRGADNKRLGMARKRYKSALAAGKTVDEAHAIGLATHPKFKPPAS